MKQAYTQFHPFLAPSSMDDALRRVLDYDKGDVESARLWLYAMAIRMQMSWRDGKTLNVFLPDDCFCDWLVGCVREPQPNLVQLMQESLKEGTIALHFPSTSKFRSSFLLSISPPTKAIVHSVLCFSKEDKTLPETGVLPCDIWPTDPRVLRHAKLVAGLAMYLHCFPETLVEGLPSDLKHPSHHQHEDVFTIGVSEKVKLGGTHDSPTPHFRVGHFRVLRSEKFTHKRFQTVFVHETFVRGVAKTVLSPEEADSAELVVEQERLEAGRRNSLMDSHG